MDEGTQYEEDMVLYLMSRLRNPACPVRPHIKITCNPDADSFLREWVDWYLLDSGLPDPDKAGKVRYFVRLDNKMHWASSEEELFEKFGPTCTPMSFCFIPANIYDNPVLMKLQPEYVSWLESLGRVERARLLLGNWDVREESSGFWKEEWCEKTPLPPTEIVARCRAWDISGSLPSETYPNPDWTVGALLSKDKYGVYYVEDIVRFRARHGEVQERILEVAKHDGGNTLISIPCDPGAAGKAYAASIVSDLADSGFYARIKKADRSKVNRFAPFAATSEAGNVMYVAGEWNKEFIQELERFDGSRNVKDDIVDAVGDAFQWLSRAENLPYFMPADLSVANPFKL